MGLSRPGPGAQGPRRLRRRLARQPSSLAQARQPSSLARQPQSLARQAQGCHLRSQQQQCRQQRGLCWLCKKYGVGRGKAAAQRILLTQPATSSLLPTLLLLTSQMATLGLPGQTLRLPGQT